jgi:hypothetical protein
MWFILKHTGINVCVPGVRAKTVLNCTCVPRGALSFHSIFRTMASNVMNLGESKLQVKCFMWFFSELHPL